MLQTSNVYAFCARIGIRLVAISLISLITGHMVPQLVSGALAVIAVIERLEFPLVEVQPIQPVHTCSDKRPF